MSAKIEKAYKRDPTGSFEGGEEMKYKIDFKTMTETCLHPDNNQTMKIYRKECEGISTPKHLVPKKPLPQTACVKTCVVVVKGVFLFQE